MVMFFLGRLPTCETAHLTIREKEVVLCAIRADVEKSDVVIFRQCGKGVRYFPPHPLLLDLEYLMFPVSAS
jgi:hypothetical protein